jgi:hypothetical protein
MGASAKEQLIVFTGAPQGQDDLAARVLVDLPYTRAKDLLLQLPGQGKQHDSIHWPASLARSKYSTLEAPVNLSPAGKTFYCRQGLF